MTVRAIIYLIVSFGFSWAVALFIHLSGGFSSFGPWVTLTLVTYMAGPMIGALLCIGLYEKGRRLEALGLNQPRWREMPWAWAGGLMLIIGALLITISVPGYGLGDPVEANRTIVNALPEARLSQAEKEAALVQLDYPGMAWILAFAALFLGPAINTVMTLTEELGWRGYLWDQIKFLGFWKASLITGALWGVWHMPIIWLGHNYPAAPIFGSIAFIGLCILMSPLYTWVRVKTGSVWGAGLLHGTTNAAAGYFILWQEPMTMPWQGLVGIGGYIAAAISVFAIYAVWQKQRPTIN